MTNTETNEIPKNFSMIGRLSAVPLWSALIVSFISVFVLIGWSLDIDSLKRIIPGYVVMNPLTAVMLILSSTALRLLQSPNIRLVRLAQACAAVSAIAGLLQLFAVAGFFDLGIDQILFNQHFIDNVTGQPNRMAPNTALNFLLLGIALMMLNVKARRQRDLYLSQYLAIAVIFTSFLAIIGYIYSAKSFYVIVSFNPMAIHTAVSFFLLAVGLVSSRPEKGIIKEIISPETGGAMARRLFPVIIIIPAFLGWLRLYGEKSEFFETEMGTALLIVTIITVFSVIVLNNARSMNIADSKRKRVDDELSASKILLTKFVAHTPAAVAMLDTEMRYLQVSERWLQDYKLIGQDIIGKSHYEVFTDISDSWKAVHQRCLAGAVEKCDEDSFPRADGTLDWLQWETRPWQKPDGTIGGVIFFTQVITERKQNEELMRQSEEKYRNILETIEEGYFETDLAGNNTFFNDAFCLSLGYDECEVQGMNYRRQVDSANKKKLLAEMVKIFETGQPVNQISWEIIRKDKKQRFVESSISL